MRAKLGLLIATVALALPACGGSEPKRESASNDGKPANAQDTIKIGALLPLSGDKAGAGADMLNGAKLAAEDLNDAGGVLRRRIEIVPGDDRCEADAATAAADQLAAAGVVGVAGAYCSGAAIPATVVLDGKGLPFISAYASNPTVTDRGLRTVFRVCGRDDQQGPFAARFLAGPGGVKKLALLHDNTVYAKDLADQVRSASDRLGLRMQIVWFDAITPGQSDYRPTLNAIEASGADTLYFTGYSTEAGFLIPQAKEVAPGLRLTGGDATTDLVLPAAGPAADGYVATTSPLPGFLPRGDAFTQAYSQRFGRLPGAGSVYEYDAVRVLAGAIFSAGSTEPKDIVEALRTTRTDGLSGDISFDAKGDRQASVYVTAIVRAGGFRPYKKLNGRGEWIDG